METEFELIMPNIFGYEVLPYHASMIAKIMAHAATRQEAIAKMEVALTEFIVSGIGTNIDFQLFLLRNTNFKKGKGCF